jgi:hypothetical protein
VSQLPSPDKGLVMNDLKILKVKLNSSIKALSIIIGPSGVRAPAQRSGH